VERLASAVSKVTTLLGLSRSQTYELVAEGAIPAIPSRTGASRSLGPSLSSCSTPHTPTRPLTTPTIQHPTVTHAPSARHSASLHAGRSNPIHTVAPGCAMTRAVVTGD